MDSNFLIGSDPEFVGYSKKDNKFKSLVGMFGGSKKEPLRIEIPGCAVQEDNVNVEFTVPPFTEFYKLHNIINKCIGWGTEHLKDKGIILLPKSSARYDESELQSKEAATFGCDPSFCVYTQGITILPEDVGNLRCAGFHIHIGFQERYSEKEYNNLIKLCDAFLGIPSLIHEKDKDRKLIYGSLGDFRYQPWGVEYRTMGSEMFNHPYHVSYGLGAISNILRLNIVEEFLEKIEDKLYILYNEKSKNYKSKEKAWNVINSLYMEL